MDVIVVCHTEFGTIKDREIVYDKSIKEGVSAGVPNLLKIAGRHGAKVTFAVMPEVAEYIAERDRQEMVSAGHEIGLHIHPGWEAFDGHGYVGDTYLRERCRMSSTSSVLRNYPYAEQLDMITVGKERIQETLGIELKTFVAGRWSLNNDTVKALITAGFTHDCSATPHKKPCHHDWSRLPRICMPYHPSADDYQRPGDLPLLIIPVSRTLIGASVSIENIPYVGRRWLESCFMEYYRQGMPLFHLCLHSPCMTDPFLARETDRLVSFIASHDVSFKRASDIREQMVGPSRADLLSYVHGLSASIARTGLRAIARPGYMASPGASRR